MIEDTDKRPSSSQHVLAYDHHHYDDGRPTTTLITANVIIDDQYNNTPIHDAPVRAVSSKAVLSRDLKKKHAAEQSHVSRKDERQE